MYWWSNRLTLSYQMKNRFKKTVEMEKSIYLVDDYIDASDDDAKEKMRNEIEN